MFSYFYQLFQNFKKHYDFFIPSLDGLNTSQLLHEESINNPSFREAQKIFG